MKKILGVLLAACFMFLPLVASAASKDKIDLSKYKTLNLTETLNEEEIEVKYSEQKENDKQVVVYMFRGKGCGYCRAFLEFLNDNTNELGDKYRLVSFESWYDDANSELLTTISTYLGQAAQGVPYIILGDQVFPGYASNYDDAIKSAITTLYDQEEKFDVFEAYNADIDAENKAANAGSNKIIVWNFVFIFVATVVIILVIKSVESNIIGEINDGRINKTDYQRKEVIQFENEDGEPIKKPVVKKTNNKKRRK